MTPAKKALKDMITEGLHTDFIFSVATESNITSEKTGGIAVFESARNILDSLDSGEQLLQSIDSFEGHLQAAVLASRGTSSLYASQTEISMKEFNHVLEVLDAVREEARNDAS